MRPSGNLPQGPDCKTCHGSLVDNIEDGHWIPTYDPSPRTPKRSGANGLPLNNEGTGAGGCDYCHSTGTGDPSIPGVNDASGILVYSNEDTHHLTGFGGEFWEPTLFCFWCHDFSLPFEAQIRVCENCHGPDSLHNIQTDSDGDGISPPALNFPDTAISVILMTAGDVMALQLLKLPLIWLYHSLYKHISESVLTAGNDSAILLNGSAFTNTFGKTEMTSGVNLSGKITLQLISYLI